MAPPRPILFYGYYDDFAHFFAKIAKALAETDGPAPDVHFASGYPSGVLAWRRHVGAGAHFLAPRVAWGTVRGWLSHGARPPVSAYRGYRPKRALAYQLQETGRHRAGPALVARIQAIDALVARLEPGLVIVSGDARPSARLAIAAAQRHGARVLYFEQGPFGTTFLDPHGVNANMGTHVLDLETTPQDPPAPPPGQSPARPGPERRKPWLRATDFAVSLIPGWPREYRSALPLRRPARGHGALVRAATGPAPEGAVLLALQVPQDANFLVHGCFADFESLVRLVAASLPPGQHLAVREHPKFLGRYEPGLYQLISEDPRLSLQRGVPGAQAIAQACAVITINSMMGLEALMAEKPVFILGEAYYQAACARASAPHRAASELRAFLETADGPSPAGTPTPDVRARFVHGFFRDIALPGHFRDAGPQAAQAAAARIRAYLAEDLHTKAPDAVKEIF